MRILLYGFKPWEKIKTNITKEILKKIKTTKNIKKSIFDVKFEKKQFIDKVKKVKPNVIIGLGMHPRGKKIRIERKAINLKKESKDEKPIKISKKDEKQLLVNLKIKKDKGSWIS